MLVMVLDGTFDAMYEKRGGHTKIKNNLLAIYLG